MLDGILPSFLSSVGKCINERRLDGNIHILGRGDIFVDILGGNWSSTNRGKQIGFPHLFSVIIGNCCNSSYIWLGGSMV